MDMIVAFVTNDPAGQLNPVKMYYKLLESVNVCKNHIILLIGENLAGLVVKKPWTIMQRLNLN